MHFSRTLVLTSLLACNGEVQNTGDAGDGGAFDATSEAVSDAQKEAAIDVVSEAAKDGGVAQCSYSVSQVDDAGLCHGGAQTLDCAAQDPSFDRCVVAQLHELDGAAFVAMQCFDGDAETGQAVCCNGLNPAGVVLLVDPSSTCCPGPAPDGGTAACAANEQCAAADAGWTCQ